MSNELISAVAVSKHFGRVNALNNVSLTIGAGETVAVMGPSGSGKSTLLHCLSGVLVPDSGEVLFASRPFSTLSDSQRSHTRLGSFGFIFQDGQLLEELTARENVALPLMLKGTPRGKALNSADAALARLGLTAQRNRRPGDMSGGQAQRVAIARALAVKPAVVFADEPTGALDQTTGAEVMQELIMAVQTTGCSLVVVTHDPTVAGWCSRLVEIRDGRVHADRALSASGEER